MTTKKGVVIQSKDGKEIACLDKNGFSYLKVDKIKGAEHSKGIIIRNKNGEKIACLDRGGFSYLKVNSLKG